MLNKWISTYRSSCQWTSGWQFTSWRWPLCVVLFSWCSSAPTSRTWRLLLVLICSVLLKQKRTSNTANWRWPSLRPLCLIWFGSLSMQLIEDLLGARMKVLRMEPDIFHFSWASLTFCWRLWLELCIEGTRWKECLLELDKRQSSFDSFYINI